MKIHIFIFVLILKFSSFSINAQTSKSEKVIMDRTRLFNQAFLETKDSIALDELLAKDGLFGNFQNYVQKKNESIKTILQSKIVYDTKPVSNMTVTLSGKKTAICSYILDATETIEEGIVTQKRFRVMLFWIKEKGKWQIFGSQPVSVEKI